MREFSAWAAGWLWPISVMLVGLSMVEWSVKYRVKLLCHLGSVAIGFGLGACFGNVIDWP